MAIWWMKCLEEQGMDIEKLKEQLKVDGYHNADSKYFDGSYKAHTDWKNKQTISAPLIGWTKKQQWDYLRDDLKELVQSCFYYSNCGKCIKCEEFKLLDV